MAVPPKPHNDGTEPQFHTGLIMIDGKPIDRKPCSSHDGLMFKQPDLKSLNELWKEQKSGAQPWTNSSGASMLSSKVKESEPEYLVLNKATEVPSSRVHLWTNSSESLSCYLTAGLAVDPRSSVVNPRPLKPEQFEIGLSFTNSGPSATIKPILPETAPKQDLKSKQSSREPEWNSSSSKSNSSSTCCIQ
ncbi:hypothetical protein NC653_020105 [Populus alba x Populus x berolinensis]|uniref:Uncharacterized protein n=2 Tax=Populus TaxID=3689 RepID=A0A4U5Q3P7_POPAL|nr:hypothetical protein NC653_020105 [Populus alba x Populus x berolinensis]TKS04754.1 hypothetical protein D5086_0000139900 [Populus alba]